MPARTTRIIPVEALWSDLDITISIGDPKDEAHIVVAQHFRDAFERYHHDHAALYSALSDLASQWPIESILLMAMLYITRLDPKTMEWLRSKSPHNDSIDPGLLMIAQSIEIIQDVFHLIPRDFFSEFAFTIEDAEEILPRFNIKTPSSLVMPISKPVQLLSKEPPNQGEIPINVGGKTKEILVLLSLSMPVEGVTLPDCLTPYDRAVFHAVCSEAEQGNNFIWPKGVFYTMTGRPRGTHVSEKSIASVDQSLRKMMSQQVKLDYSAQARAYRKEGIEAVKEGKMIDVQELTAFVNGEKRSGYRLLREPLLLEYSKIFKQVVTIPMKILDAGGAVQNTEHNIPLKHYLAERVELAKNPKNKIGNRIRFETIASECGLPTSTKQQQHRTRTTVKKIFEQWKVDGYIKGYTANTQSVSFTWEGCKM